MVSTLPRVTKLTSCANFPPVFLQFSSPAAYMRLDIYIWITYYHIDFVIILRILHYHYKGRKLIRNCCVNSILHPIIHYCRILLIVYKEHSVDTMETCKDNLHHHDPKNHKMYMKISTYHVS